MPRYACLRCGAPTLNPSKRCDRHPLPKRASGARFERTREAVRQRDGMICGICGQPVQRHDDHIDHVIPRAHGGSDHPSNLRLTCADCNLKRGTAA